MTTPDGVVKDLSAGRVANLGEHILDSATPKGDDGDDPPPSATQHDAPGGWCMLLSATHI